MTCERCDDPACDFPAAIAAAQAFPDCASWERTAEHGAALSRVADAYLACHQRPAKDWRASSKAFERLLADAEARDAELTDAIRAIQRAVGAQDGPGGQSMEGTEARIRRDAVARVLALAERCAAAEREVDRLRTGATIEGDHVGRLDLERTASSDEYDDDLENLRDTIAEHLPTYAGDHEGEDADADAIDTVIAAGDDLKRAKAWRVRVEPLAAEVAAALEELPSYHQILVSKRGVRLMAAIDLLLAAALPEDRGPVIARIEAQRSMWREAVKQVTNARALIAAWRDGEPGGVLSASHVLGQVETLIAAVPRKEDGR